jgi:chromosome segregation ATPase
MGVTDWLQLGKKVVTLADDIQRYNAELKELRQDLNNLTIQVNRLADKIEHSEKETASEIKILKLELENALLRAKQLPPSGGDE